MRGRLSLTCAGGPLRTVAATGAATVTATATVTRPHRHQARRLRALSP